MTFADLTRAQAHLRGRAFQKEAGVIGRAIGAPFKAMGWGAGKAIKGVGKAGLLPFKAMHGATVRSQGKVMGNLMFAGGVVGIGAAAVGGVGKAKTYNRGFDPRIQNASMQRVR